MDDVTQAVLALLGSPWLYPVVFAITALDALLIVVPSETVVVALGATAAATGTPDLRIVAPVAAAAAVLGDNLGYLVGRSVGIDRIRWMRRPTIARAFAWARRALDRRAAVVILTARFVPFGRLAVNLTAGATGFPLRRFVPLTIVAGTTWALYNVGVGAVFGTWLEGQPVLAVVVSVVVAVSLGIAVDAINSRLMGSRRAATPADSARKDRGGAVDAPDWRSSPTTIQRSSRMGWLSRLFSRSPKPGSSTPAPVTAMDTAADTAARTAARSTAEPTEAPSTSPATTVDSVPGQPAATEPAERIAATPAPTAAEAVTPAETAAQETPLSAPVTGSDDVPTASLTVPQLRERAKAMGLTGYSRLGKADLIALIENAR